MALHRPALQRQRTALQAALPVLALALALLGLCWQAEQPVQSLGFVGAPGLRPQVAPESMRRLASPVQLRAEGGEVVDADVVGEEEEEEEAFDDEEEEEAELDAAGAYPAEAYKEYAYEDTPPESWFERNKIDRHKVNTIFFNQFSKPRTFFPHKLQPGDTVRVYYLDPLTQGDARIYDIKGSISQYKETFFDGVILNFRGEYHARTMTMRAMVGKGEGIMGMEMQFPMHSPLIRKIDVLRRGYIGRNKNAYFIRGMIGKKNIIPLDQERTQMDEMYASLREQGRADEIPEPEYPQQEWDRYPLPLWKQDMDEWEEEKYNADLVDQRSEYERRVIGRFKKRLPGPSGRVSR